MVWQVYNAFLVWKSCCFQVEVWFVCIHFQVGLLSWKEKCETPQINMFLSENETLSQSPPPVYDRTVPSTSLACVLFQNCCVPSKGPQSPGKPLKLQPLCQIRETKRCDGSCDENLWVYFSPASEHVYLLNENRAVCLRGCPLSLCTASVRRSP